MLIWLGAIAVGFSLGLLGSGGSILTVPILVYLVDETEKVAIAESLAIVGTIGVGGGFLIVPALVLLGGLTMHQAVGTSLAIIALKSATGFYKYLDVLSQADLSVSWNVVTLFAALGIAGSFAGGAIAHRLPQSVLQRVFAVLLIAMGLFIVSSSLGFLPG